ncbi:MULTISPECIES: hypothetical protein [Dyella]|uniref:Secreted protein n=2 Tax=Dyella TaxID=231454 RepID=A0A4V2NMJ7_9GAMM|nr:MULTISPECIES: hypothetical protein [Dyella]TBR38782.1 hypothetical protein EYV96_00550 [Dyella terrae]TCI13627.1 hypothetical protein EZM97_10320 [Dyella soli]
MNTLQRLAFPALLLVMASTHAQSTTPLNLKLPPGSVPASTSTSAPAVTAVDVKPANPSTTTRPSAAAAAPVRPAPGVYYGDTSGRTRADYEAAARQGCDDATYNQPQIHGSVGMGVQSGSHWNSGTYGMGEVNLSQRFGSCTHPTGGVGISIGTTQFHGR